MTMTTRFLLGRRGRHLYQLRQHPGASHLTSPSSSSSASTYTTATTANSSTIPLGRHGVPPTKRNRSWNCRHKRRQQQQPSTPYYYSSTYLFPIPASTTSSTTSSSWRTSPLFLTVLMLLLGCFLVGAYCFVGRFDTDHIQQQPLVLHLSNNNQHNGNKQQQQLLVQDTFHHHNNYNHHHYNPADKAPPKSIPKNGPQPQTGPLLLFLNMTLLHIPCEDIHVQVSVQMQQGTNHNNDSTKVSSLTATTTSTDESTTSTERLIFKTVQYKDSSVQNRLDPQSESTYTSGSTISTGKNSNNNALADQKPSSHAALRKRRRLPQDDNGNAIQNDQPQSITTTTDSHNLQYISPHHHRRNLQPTRHGCQMYGHLHIPMEKTTQNRHNHLGSGILSLKINKNNDSTTQFLDLAHQVHQLQLQTAAGGGGIVEGNEKIIFPKEETMILHRAVSPTRTYSSTETVHYFQVQENRQIIEQPPPQEKEQQQQQQQQSLQHIPEIRFVFVAAPSSTR